MEIALAGWRKPKRAFPKFKNSLKFLNDDVKNVASLIVVLQGGCVPLLIVNDVGCKTGCARHTLE